MRFVVDECTGPHVARWLRSRGHEAIAISDEMRGADDRDVLAFALASDAILITNDTDFGDRVFRDREEHAGVILLRLRDDIAAAKIAALDRVFAQLGTLTQPTFVVATDRRVRIARRAGP